MHGEAGIACSFLPLLLRRLVVYVFLLRFFLRSRTHFWRGVYLIDVRHPRPVQVELLQPGTFDRLEADAAEFAARGPFPGYVWLALKRAGNWAKLPALLPSFRAVADSISAAEKGEFYMEPLSALRGPHNEPPKRCRLIAGSLHSQ